MLIDKLNSNFLTLIIFGHDAVMVNSYIWSLVSNLLTTILFLHYMETEVMIYLVTTWKMTVI